MFRNVVEQKKNICFLLNLFLTFSARKYILSHNPDHILWHVYILSMSFAVLWTV